MTIKVQCKMYSLFYTPISKEELQKALKTVPHNKSE